MYSNLKFVQKKMSDINSCYIYMYYKLLFRLFFALQFIHRNHFKFVESYLHRHPNFSYTQPYF